MSHPINPIPRNFFYLIIAFLSSWSLFGQNSPTDYQLPILVNYERPHTPLSTKGCFGKYKSAPKYELTAVSYAVYIEDTNEENVETKQLAYKLLHLNEDG
jgi:hypothetical protein